MQSVQGGGETEERGGDGGRVGERRNAGLCCVIVVELCGVMRCCVSGMEEGFL